MQKKILIFGEHSYIGCSFAQYMQTKQEQYELEFMSSRKESWRKFDFSSYAAILHVAGIAHVNHRGVTQEMYHKVNCDLAVAVAQKAKQEGVPYFIFLSSILVYGESAPIGEQKRITIKTQPDPQNAYAKSKYESEMALQKLASSSFHIAILRLPMIYGPGAKGNYALLKRMAPYLFIFPNCDQRRSMLFIGDLCELLYGMLKREPEGVFYPQNAQLVCVGEMIQCLRKGKKVYFTSFGASILRYLSKRISFIRKIFGDLAYEPMLSQVDAIPYQKTSFRKSLSIRTVGKPKALIVASVVSMIWQFNLENIKLLQSLGYQVHIACDFLCGSTFSEKEAKKAKEQLQKMHCILHQIPIPRTVYAIRKMRDSYHILQEILQRETFSLIHCQSPIGGVLTRVAARKERKQGTYLIYTAHGFHFYRGASLQNWLLFYPIERYCARQTDCLVTMNQEDFLRAKVFRTGHLVKIPGIGIQTEKYIASSQKRRQIRAAFQIEADQTIILMAAEYIKRKNHVTALRAFAALKRSDTSLFLCGQGPLERSLKELAEQLGVEKRVFFLGYRTDLASILAACDIFFLPSYQEGLSVALMEAMAAGLPVVASKIRGNQDLICQGKGGYLCDPNDQNGFTAALRLLCEKKQERARLGQYNQKKIKNYDCQIVNQMMRNIYEAAGK